MFTFTGFTDEISPSMDEQIRVLRDLNIHYIELRNVDGRNITELSEDETQALKRKLDANEISVSAIGSPLGKIRISDPFEPHLALFDHCVDQARILGTGYIRLFSFYDAFNDREEVLRRLQAFLDHTPSGIILLHENEKGIYGNNAARCLDLFRSIHSPKLMATYDPANFIQEKQETSEAMDLLLPYIRYIHVKDARFSDGQVVAPGTGDAHWNILLDKLRMSGFSGFLSMEPHLADFAGFKALEQNADLGGKKDMSQGETMWRYAYGLMKNMLKEEEIR